MVKECPAGLENWLRIVKVPAKARNRRIAAVRNTRNPATTDCTRDINKFISLSI